MAGQPSAAAPLSAAAHVVGNAFVNQYYHVLHNTPQVVHRFYTDASRLTRAEAGSDGAVDTVVSQSEIHNKVMALDYGDFKAEIITVDSQDSFSGGVLVMVTGSLSSKLQGKRNFVQSFFLAPQEKGYYVLNDIFRYLDEEPITTRSRELPLPVHSNGIPEPPPVHNVVEQEPTHSADHHEVREEVASSQPSEVEVDEIFDIPDQQVEVSEPEEDAGIEELTHVETTPVIDEPPSPMAEPPVAAPPVEEVTGEAPKKSYASILRHQTTGTPVQPPAFNAASKAAAPAPERPSVTPGFQASSAVAHSSQEVFDDGVPLENEADGRSVYVKNLPMNVGIPQLEEEFLRFGPIKPGGVYVRSQKQGVCYGFVEFEDASSATSAIESPPITIGGRQVFIEEKKQMGRGGGRGRAPVGGRGDRPFRGDGIRGRGDRGYPGGRGGNFGGRGIGQDRDMSNRGRGSGPARSGSGNYGGANNGNSGAGANASGADNFRQGGNGSRQSRRGANQMTRNGAVTRGGTPVAAA
ncbi:hypothetical protein R1flu_016426 [Riccia fluitans]|uniref:G3BP-like protein n=1 Tax=Riccia fluitans TaxID=41844 RepID=A0ABD1YM64_9MARC